MRKILFRGKPSGNAWITDWVYGAFCPQNSEGNSPCIIVYNGRFAGYWFEVTPETVGQYTGLTDKNGTKIFEGDIVESEYTKKPYIVRFGEYIYINEYGKVKSVCGWYNEEKGGYVTAFGRPETWATIIGNIHDNPELMEGEQSAEVEK